MRKHIHLSSSSIERLEPRRLLAVSALFDAATQTLTLIGSEQAYALPIAVWGSGVNVYGHGAPDQFFSFEQYPAKRLRVEALDGNDQVTLFVQRFTPQLEFTIELGDGGDTFTGSGAAMTILGSAGNDTITGTYFNDLLVGGDGDDSLDGSAGRDTLDGGGGFDRATDDGIDTLIHIEQRLPIHGSLEVLDDGTLLVLGTDDADNIYLAIDTLSVNDVRYNLDEHFGPSFPPIKRIEIRGRGGDDRISAFEPRYPGAMYPLTDRSVVLDGGDGNDTFTIVDTVGYVIGGEGDDVVHLAYQSRLLGFEDSGGIDAIDATIWDGFPGIIDLRLYPTIEIATHSGPIIGNDLDNLLILTGRSGTLLGGKGNDTLVMYEGEEALLDGGEGDDYLAGPVGFYGPAVTLNGGAGRDTLVGDENSTYLNGEIVDPPPPPNPMSFDPAGNVTIAGTDGPDVISIFVLSPGAPYGSDHGGYALINRVPYILGRHELLNATITVMGKSGDDLIEMRASGAGVRGYFDGGDGNDTLIGGSYDDTLLGGRGNDLLIGNAGADAFFGGDGKDTIHARDGVAEIVDGGKGNDKAEADALDVLIDVKGKKKVKVKTK